MIPFTITLDPPIAGIRRMECDAQGYLFVHFTGDPTPAIQKIQVSMPKLPSVSWDTMIEWLDKSESFTVTNENGHKTITFRFESGFSYSFSSTVEMINRLLAYETSNSKSKDSM